MSGRTATNPGCDIWDSIAVLALPADKLLKVGNGLLKSLVEELLVGEKRDKLRSVTSQ